MSPRVLFTASRHVAKATFRSPKLSMTRLATSNLRSMSTVSLVSQNKNIGNEYGPHPHLSNHASYLAFLAAGAAAVSSLPQIAHSDAAAATKTQSLSSEFLDDRIDLTPLSRVEGSTSVSFPTAVSPSQKLFGLGARIMRGLVKVYALGVYLDPASLPSTLSPWAAFSPAELHAAPPVWRALCDPSVPKTMRMVTVRNVPGKHMCDGFERALLPRVKARAAATGGKTPREAQDAARMFCKWFVEVGNMKSGSIILMSVRDSRAELTIDGRLMGSVTDPCLAWALADMFLGDGAVIPPLRADVAESLSSILKGDKL